MVGELRLVAVAGAKSILAMKASSGLPPKVVCIAPGVVGKFDEVVAPPGMTYRQPARFRIDLSQRTSIEVETEHDLSDPTIYLASDFINRRAYEGGR